MTKSPIISAQRPTSGSESDLRRWDRDQREATQKFADWLCNQPVNSLSVEDLAFLALVAPEPPID